MRYEIIGADKDTGIARNLTRWASSEKHARLIAANENIIVSDLLPVTPGYPALTVMAVLLIAFGVIDIAIGIFMLLGSGFAMLAPATPEEAVAGGVVGFFGGVVALGFVFAGFLCIVNGTALFAFRDIAINSWHQRK